MSVGHLCRRFLGSLSRKPPGTDDSRWAGSFLTPAELELWLILGNADRRHAITVARRFVALRADATREEIAGALLHDIGKVESNLGTLGRVLATVVGPHGGRFRDYHDHERLGAEMLAAARSAPATVALVRGEGPAAPALRAADDV